MARTPCMRSCPHTCPHDLTIQNSTSFGVYTFPGGAVNKGARHMKSLDSHPFCHAPCPEATNPTNKTRPATDREIARTLPYWFRNGGYNRSITGWREQCRTDTKWKPLADIAFGLPPIPPSNFVDGSIGVPTAANWDALLYLRQFPDIPTPENTCCRPFDVDCAARGQPAFEGSPAPTVGTIPSPPAPGSHPRRYNVIAPPPTSQPLPSAAHHLTSLSGQPRAGSSSNELLLTPRETDSRSSRVNVPSPSPRSHRASITQEVQHDQNCGFNPSLLMTEHRFDHPEKRHSAHPAHLRKHFDNAANSVNRRVEREESVRAEDDSDCDNEEVTAMLLDFDDEPVQHKSKKRKFDSLAKERSSPYIPTGWRALVQNEDISTPFAINSPAFMKEVADCISRNVLTVRTGDRQCNRCRLRRQKVNIPCATPTTGPADQPCLLCKAGKKKCIFSSRNDTVDSDSADINKSSGYPTSQVLEDVPMVVEDVPSQVLEDVPRQVLEDVPRRDLEDVPSRDLEDVPSQVLVHLPSQAEKSAEDSPDTHRPIRMIRITKDPNALPYTHPNFIPFPPVPVSRIWAEESTEPPFCFYNGVSPPQKRRTVPSMVGFYRIQEMDQR